MTIRTGLTMAIIVAVAPALAWGQAAESDRTVTYYANNPYVREKVLQQCSCNSTRTA